MHNTPLFKINTVAYLELGPAGLQLLKYQKLKTLPKLYKYLTYRTRIIYYVHCYQRKKRLHIITVELQKAEWLISHQENLL